MDTTKKLLKDYKDLRDTISEFGPNDRLLATLGVCEVELLAQQVEQDYLTLKEVYPDPIELLEMAKPLSAAGKRNLDAAATVSQEIEQLLDGSKQRSKKAHN